MTVSVVHATSIDDSFSTAGAAAWNAGHTVTGAANSVPYFGGGVLTDSSSLTYDDTTKRLTVGTGSGASAGWQIGYSASIGSGYSEITSTSVTADGTNYALLANSATTFMNAPGATGVLRFRRGNTTIATLGAAGDVAGAAGAGFYLAAGTAASAVSALSLTQEWNYNGAAINAVDWTFTDTSSHANTLAWRVMGGASGTTLLASLARGGQFLTGGNIGAGAAFYVNPNSVIAPTTWGAAMGTTGVVIASNATFRMSSTTSGEGTADTSVSRGGAAGIVAIGTGAAGSTAGTLRAAALAAGGSDFTVTAANSVSPTSPNRTITISYGGTTYYLSAKTSND